MPIIKTGPDQGSKSRKISYRAFVHGFVCSQNIFRARKNRAKNLNRATIARFFS